MRVAPATIHLDEIHTPVSELLGVLDLVAVRARLGAFAVGAASVGVDPKEQAFAVDVVSYGLDPIL